MMSFSIHPKEMRTPTSTGYLDRTLLSACQILTQIGKWALFRKKSIEPMENP